MGNGIGYIGGETRCLVDAITGDNYSARPETSKLGGLKASIRHDGLYEADQTVKAGLNSEISSAYGARTHEVFGERYLASPIQVVWVYVLSES